MGRDSSGGRPSDRGAAKRSTDAGLIPRCDKGLLESNFSGDSLTVSAPIGTLRVVLSFRRKVPRELQQQDCHD